MKSKTSALLLVVLMMAMSIFVTKAKAQGTPGPGFHLDAADVRYIFHQIQIGEAHAAQTRIPGNAPNCSALLGPGPNQLGDPRFPYGLRTVNGNCNNLITGQEQFGSSFTQIPRLTSPFFRTAEQGTSYLQTSGNVFDSRPRIISNLIVDQTAKNPAAVAAAGPTPQIDPAGTLFIPNVAPDLGISAQYNALFTFFGQFFDHGLTFLRKGGNGTVLVPLQPDDPLNTCAPPLQCAFATTPGFIPLTRATMLAGPDGIVGTADDIHEGTNEDTPWIDQNQTYTSHASHQVFLRAYQLVAGKPVPTGKMLDGAIPGNIGNWAEVKAQASTLLGIQLQDIDVLNVPLLLTDPYGHFVPGPHGFPQVAMPGGVFVEGNPAAPVSVVGSLKADTTFLCDIAHAADPSNPGYDPALLGAHFATGDCRGNENIALTAIHNVLHLEHNRLTADIEGIINTLTPAEIANWHANNPDSGWGYGERLFQAARFVTEQEYQRIVVDTFARKVQPAIQPFAGSKLDVDPDTDAEYSHASYRFGHSMLNDIVARTNVDGSVNNILLLDAFLNPREYNNGGTAGPLTAAQVIGALARGMSREVGNEVDEFVTEAVRDQLVGLPLDLPAINITRGRSEGVAPLNVVRQQLFAASGNPAVIPYNTWLDFWLNMRHPDSLVNFVAAYGTDPAITSAVTVADKRAAATALVCLFPPPADCVVNTSYPLLSAPAATSGLNDVDLWVGGLAERPSQFGGLLGSTHNYIFTQQLQKLQDFDRFYYVGRSKGLNLLNQLEQNSLTELIMRNSDLEGMPDDPFSMPPVVFNIATLNPAALPADLTVLPDGTIVYTGVDHLLVICGAADCRFKGGASGDDTIRGGAGNDRLDGGQSNDHVLGGAGDDIITNEFGDDVLEGGDGNDAISCGPNGGAAIMFGGSGQDFMVAGDPCPGLGGPGNDFLFAGDAAKNPVGKQTGEEGDDWVEGGKGDDALIGDCNDPFEGLVDVCTPGNDVLVGGGSGGDLGDEMLAEGGDDILAPGSGKSINRGGFGYDWTDYKLRPTAADADLNILIVDPLGVNFLRDRFAMVEALSGSPFNDILRGDNRIFGGTVFAPPIPGQTCDPVLTPGTLETTFYCNELSPAGIANIAGLDALTAGRTLPAPNAGTFAQGNIILGGPGSDMILGRDGDDIIDGDAWLQVQLHAVYNDGHFRDVDSMLALTADVFADPQLLNPGNITIVRSIVGHTGAAGTDVDTAVYRKARSFYTVTVNADGSITVADNIDPKCAPGVLPAGRLLVPCDGTDTLWNIERIAFPDGTLDTATNLFTPKAGLGAALNVTPVALAFPNQVIGTTSVPQVVTVPNISPVSISLFSFTITGVNAADFAVTSTCPGVLAPATACTASVTFTPTAAGARSAVLQISSTDPLSPMNIPLAGGGNFPAAAPVFTSACPTTATVGVAYTCTVVATDPNGGVVTYSLVAPVPAGMVINAATGVISWTPTAAGSFPFTVQATGPGGISTQTTTVAVSLAPGAPIAVNDTATSRAGRAVTIRVLANDVASAGSTLVPASVRIVTPPSHGTATPNVRGTVTYTPNPGFTGVDTFTYDVQDNLGRTSNAATVTVTVR